MASKGFSLNFDGFLDFAREVDELGEGYLQKAVDNAFTATKDYAHAEIKKAIASSKYHFDKGQGYSQGKIKKSLAVVEQMPVEWKNGVAYARIGVRVRDALEIIFLIHGSPHTPKDKNLFNAVKVKGKHQKAVEEIQQAEFKKVIEEALNG